MAESVWAKMVMTWIYVTTWIVLSIGVIMYNKWILAYSGFPYPVALTMMHMGFCSIAAVLMVKVFKWVEPVKMDFETYLRAIVPIGALYAGTLWLGNGAYLFLSVSFIQMLKALMPVSVYSVGVTMGVEAYEGLTFWNMVFITAGVVTASYGEVNFVLIGVLMQLASVATESTRLTLIQILLQRRGLKLNPVTSLYYISPACFAFLSIPFAFVEAPRIAADDRLHFDPLIMLGNCACAFALNMAVFLLIGKTSALTMNLAGVIKDWMLIFLSAMLFKAPITALNLIGYAIAFAGVMIYNYRKLQKMKQDEGPAKAGTMAPGGAGGAGAGAGAGAGGGGGGAAAAAPADAEAGKGGDERSALLSGGKK